MFNPWVEVLDLCFDRLDHKIVCFDRLDPSCFCFEQVRPSSIEEFYRPKNILTGKKTFRLSLAVKFHRPRKVSTEKKTRQAFYLVFHKIRFFRHPNKTEILVEILQDSYFSSEQYKIYNIPSKSFVTFISNSIFSSKSNKTRFRLCLTDKTHFDQQICCSS